MCYIHMAIHLLKRMGSLWNDTGQTVSDDLIDAQGVGFLWIDTGRQHVLPDDLHRLGYMMHQERTLQLLLTLMSFC